MIIGDAEYKRERGKKKVQDAIKLHGGITLMAAGIAGTDMRVFKATLDVGVKMFEACHCDVVVQRGLKGKTEMLGGMDVRYEITVDDMVSLVRAMRGVAGNDVYITASVPGTFTEINPVPFTFEDALALSQAGADGLLSAKYYTQDIEDLVNVAHRAGLRVDQSIVAPGSYASRLSAKSLETEEVGKYASRLEKLGADSLYVGTGMWYVGAKAGKFPDEILRRIKTVRNSVSIPVIVGGGITPSNYKDLKSSGADILAVATIFDQIAAESVAKTAKTFLSLSKK